MDLWLNVQPVSGQKVIRNAFPPVELVRRVTRHVVDLHSLDGDLVTYVPWRNFEKGDAPTTIAHGKWPGTIWFPPCDLHLPKHDTIRSAFCHCMALLLSAKPTTGLRDVAERVVKTRDDEDNEEQSKGIAEALKEFKTTQPRDEEKTPCLWW